MMRQMGLKNFQKPPICKGYSWFYAQIFTCKQHCSFIPDNFLNCSFDLRNLSVTVNFLNKFISHTIHSDDSFPSLYSSHLSSPLLYQAYTSPLLPFRKEQASKRQQSNRTKQDTKRQGKCPYTKAGQGNSTWGKEPQEQANDSRTHPQNKQTNKQTNT